MLPTLTLCLLICAVALFPVSAAHAQQISDQHPDDPDTERALRHASMEWKLVEPHLPDPATANRCQA